MMDRTKDFYSEVDAISPGMLTSLLSHGLLLIYALLLLTINLHLALSPLKTDQIPVKSGRHADRTSSPHYMRLPKLWYVLPVLLSHCNAIYLHAPETHFTEFFMSSFALWLTRFR